MNHPQLARSFLSVMLLALMSSCSSEFHKAWKNTPASQGVSGKWEGTWLSAANGHHGTLKCVVKEDLKQRYTRGPGVPADAKAHEFFYYATWKSIIGGSYKAIHQVQKKGDHFIFKGDHQMPSWAGGKYHYEGTIKGDEFNACYECSKDRGTFTMKRVR